MRPVMRWAMMDTEVRSASRAMAGFTYLMLLWWVAIAGVTAAALSRSWVMDMRREREAELRFRGEQIRLAIESYARVPVAQGASRYPARLEDLLEDSRQGVVVRHLRQLWRDPVRLQGPWGLVREPGRKDGGIQGVYSLSSQVPLHPPQGVTRYAEWRFVAGEAATPAPP